jgi:hypothetical protein
VQSEHFSVLTDADADDYGPVVDRLEDVHAALATTFFAGVPAPHANVLLFASGGDFRGVAPKDAAGYFIGGFGPDKSGLLVFPADGEDFDEVASIAAHELAHRFLHALSDRVPAWLHEGFAKYVGAVQLLGDQVIFDAAPIHGGYVYFADPVPLDQLLTVSGRDFHRSGALAHYMTAWILVRQLFGNPQPGARERFRKLVERSAASADPAAQTAAISEAFGGVAVSELEQQIRAFHHAVYIGVGQPVSRRAIAARVSRDPRPPPKVAAADRGSVRTLCQALRAGR